MKLKRKTPSSPPVLATSKVVVGGAKEYFIWGAVAKVPATNDLQIRLSRMHWGFDQAPFLNDAQCWEHSNDDAAQDSVIRRGAVFNRATYWEMSSGGLLTVRFGIEPLTNDVLSFRPEILQMLPKAPGVVPPINAIVP
jgi:hypothetical protein